jgi:hypothetical protein
MRSHFPNTLKYADVRYEDLNEWFRERGHDRVQFLYFGDGESDTPTTRFVWLLLPGNKRGYMYLRKKRTTRGDGFFIGDEYKPYVVEEWGLMDC